MFLYGLDPNAQPQPPIQQMVINLSWFSKQSNAQVLLPKGLSEKQTLAKLKREQLKKEKKDLAQQQKNSRELTTKATKVITSVEPLFAKLQKASTAVDKDKNRDKIDQMTIENLQEKIAWAQTVINESQQILKLVSSGKVVDQSQFETLHSSDIGPEVKSCNNVLKALAYARKAAKAGA